MKNILIVTAVIFMFYTCGMPTAVAQFRTGNQLYNECSNKNSSADYNFCLGYIAGMMDGLPRNTICSDFNVTLGQMVDIVVKNFSDRPDVRHYPAAAIAFVALMVAFPCPSK